MKAFLCCTAALLAGVAVIGAGDRETLSDKEFIARAMDDGISEVKMGQLAERSANSARVKEFARTLVKDHTRANKKLLDLARAHKLAVVTDMKKDAVAVYNRMSKMDRSEFDAAYLKHLVEDHKKAIALFEKMAKNARDPDLRQFASDTLPTLRKHLKTARELQAGRKGK